MLDKVSKLTDLLTVLITAGAGVFVAELGVKMTKWSLKEIETTLKNN